MNGPETYGSYPAGTILAGNILSALIWIIGAILLYGLWPLLVIPYVLFILVLEYRLLSGHCVDCWYYGKACAFGKGWLGARLFPKGNPENFCGKQMTRKDIVPDFLVLLIPVLAGIVQLATAFSYPTLALILALLILGFPGTAYVRGNLACRYCRQKEMGCPAEQMFNKKPEG